MERMRTRNRKIWIGWGVSPIQLPQWSTQVHILPLCVARILRRFDIQGSLVLLGGTEYGLRFLHKQHQGRPWIYPSKDSGFRQ